MLPFESNGVVNSYQSRQVIHVTHWEFLESPHFEYISNDVHIREDHVNSNERTNKPIPRLADAISLVCLTWSRYSKLRLGQGEISQFDILICSKKSVYRFVDEQNKPEKILWSISLCALRFPFSSWPPNGSEKQFPSDRAFQVASDELVLLNVFSWWYSQQHARVRPNVWHLPPGWLVVGSQCTGDGYNQPRKVQETYWLRLPLRMIVLSIHDA